MLGANEKDFQKSKPSMRRCVMDGTISNLSLFVSPRKCISTIKYPNVFCMDPSAVRTPDFPGVYCVKLEKLYVAKSDPIQDTFAPVSNRPYSVNVKNATLA